MNYYAQWASAELVGPIIRGQMAAKDDPRWREFGAASPEDYEFWSWRSCGMACLKTLLVEWMGAAPSMMALCNEVLDAGGYQFRDDGGLDGLTYKPFVSYARARWGLEAHVAGHLSVSQLRSAVRDGFSVLASVSPQIRRPHVIPRRRGGHLVLVHQTTPAGVVFNNPSGDLPGNQRNAHVTETDFQRFFAGRGILVRRPPGLHQTLEIGEVL